MALGLGVLQGFGVLPICGSQFCMSTLVLRGVEEFRWAKRTCWDVRGSRTDFCVLVSSYAEMEADCIFLSCSLSLLSQSALMTVFLATGECHQVSLELSY